jgi:hypothetical protein
MLYRASLACAGFVLTTLVPPNCISLSINFIYIIDMYKQNNNMYKINWCKHFSADIIGQFSAVYLCN